MTTSDGRVILTISETHSEWSSWHSEFVETVVKLYSTSFDVKKTDFQKAKVGMGAFEHKVILYSIGRITYSSFLKKFTEMTGKVMIEFHTLNGQILKGEGTIFF